MGFTRFTANPDTRPHAGGGPRGGALPQAKGSVMEMGRDGAASPDLPQTDAISNTVGRKSFSLGLQPHPRENFASAVLADGGFIQRANSTFVPPTLFPPPTASCSRSGSGARVSTRHGALARALGGSLGMPHLPAVVL